MLLIISLVVVLWGPGDVLGQKPPNTSKTVQGQHSDTRISLAQARANFIEATREYKVSLERMLVYLEADARKKASEEGKMKELFDGGLVSRRELEAKHQDTVEAQMKMDDARKKLAQADVSISETYSEVVLAEKVTGSAVGSGRYIQSALYTRYDGAAQWSLRDSSRIQNFFYQKFGQPLPVSAFGETQLHERLGYDHRNAMDVALNPESPRGVALLAYLRESHIPYIAFRGALSGKSTGAHIHIGRPSHKLSGG